MGAAGRAEVALTVDDLPQGGVEHGLERMERMTERLVGAIASRGIPAVAFVNEAQLFGVPGEVDRRIALLDAWAAAGCELGNHTHAHRRLREVPLGEFLDGVVRGEVVTPLVCARHGQRLRWFRHPYLDTGPDLATRAAVDEFLAERGYTVAPVTIDPDDWMYALVYADAKTRGDEVLMGRIAREYLGYLDATLSYADSCAQVLFGRPIRHVMLMHANELNAEHFDEVAGLLERRGFAFVPLEHALADEAYQSPITVASSAGVPWQDRWAASRGVTLDLARPDPAPRVQDRYRELDAVAPPRIPGSRN